MRYRTSLRETDPSPLDHLRCRIFNRRCLRLDTSNIHLNSLFLHFSLSAGRLSGHITRRSCPRRSNSFLIRRRRQIGTMMIDRRRHGLPVKQIRIRTHTAAPSSVRRRWIGQSFDVFIPVHYRYAQVRCCGWLRLAAIWSNFFIGGHVDSNWCLWDERACFVGQCWHFSLVSGRMMITAVSPVLCP